MSDYDAVRHAHAVAVAAPIVQARWLSVVAGGLFLTVLALSGALAYLVYQHGHLKPLVVRIDAVGNADLVAYDTFAWTPQLPEVRHIERNQLMTWAKLYFNRVQSTVAADYAASLLFMDETLQAKLGRDPSTNPVLAFAEDPTADEVKIEVLNVTIDRSTPPYRARITALERHYPPHSLRMKGDPVPLAISVLFRYSDAGPSEALKINPLGLLIADFEVDRGFTEGN